MKMVYVTPVVVCPLKLNKPLEEIEGKISPR